MLYTVEEPRSGSTPLVVEVPHAGLSVDPEAMATLIAPAQAIGRDADLYVDELYADAPTDGAALLVSHVSRYVCDLNRAESDADPLTVEGGAARSSPHGVVWRTTTDNRPALARPLSAVELERRLERIYRPYHRALAALLEARKREFGFAILLCAHSMPSRGREGHVDPGRERAEVVPGTRGRTTCAPSIISITERVAHDFSLSLAHDEPYRGGFSTGHYGKPRDGVHAIQIELSRKLYMDEQALTKKHRDFDNLKSFCRALTRALSTLSLDISLGAQGTRA
ncbi:MAG TPA: N-formylglutamate amidohydrolase [Polyangiaceae bacterium]